MKQSFYLTARHRAKAVLNSVTVKRRAAPVIRVLLNVELNLQKRLKDPSLHFHVGHLKAVPM